MKFETTISPAGEILPNYDPSQKVVANMSQAQVMALASNSIAEALLMNLRPFNMFAAACAAQSSLQSGHTWRAPAPGAPQADMQYTVLSTQQHAGRTTYTVGVQSDAASPFTLKGQGDYDPAARLLINFHADMSSNGQGEVVDLTLNP